jgi:glycosyltransferase involved in cell wall biosynthesis
MKITMALEELPVDEQIACRSGRSPLEGCDVVFVLPHLGPGGAQRVATLVLNQWAKKGLTVGLVTILDNKPDAHNLDDKVRRVHLTKLKLSGESIGSDPESPLMGKLRAIHYFFFVMDIARLIKSPEKKPYLRLVAFFFYPVRLIYRKCYKSARLVIKRIIKSTVLPMLRDPFFFQQNRTIIKYSFGSRKLRLAVARKLAGKREEKLRLLLQLSPPPRILSFLTKTNIITVLATWDLPIHVVISERNDPDLQLLEPIWEQLRRYTYGHASLATSNSVGILGKMGRFVDSTPLKLLPNPLVIPPVVQQKNGHRNNRFIIVARLTQQKAIDILLAAFAEIAVTIPEWSLDIVGDGPIRQELEEQSTTLEIQDRTRFHGHISSPVDMFNAASVFVLPSRFEGMPNSLLEAMSSGLPPIVSDSSPGPLEMVEHERTGLVVPVEDIQALAEAMLRLATNEALRVKLGNEARSLASRHEWENVEADWCDALQLKLEKVPERCELMIAR